jgi:adenosylcobinamide-phosphate synthase
MRLEYQILFAVALDLALGDPRWLPHPTRGMGLLALRLEGPMRRLIPSQYVAGIVTAGLVIGLSAGAAWGLVVAAGLIHPLAGDVVGILIMYTTIAARDLVNHSLAVYRPLAAGDLPAARRSVAMIVGRDTDNLDEPGVARAAVESVAESTVDGVTAPLFFAMLGGPVAAIAYRAINTLDSTFGYKDERYARFGWASARIDDLANLLPARLTGPAMALAAGIVGQDAAGAWRVLCRDSRNHASPNAGFAEAAAAGALGVQLGGANYYGGEALVKPTIGDAAVPLSARHIVHADTLMLGTLGLFLAVGLPMRALADQLWMLWRATQ